MSQPPPPTQPPSAPPMRPPAGGRYPRTTGGLIGSLIVTVLVVLVVWLFLRADNGAAVQRPERVDYGEAVQAATDAGLAVVYPSATPSGWEATSVALEPGARPDWGIGFLTETGRFAGLRLADDDLDDLLHTYVDADPQQGADTTFESPLATTWSTWSDSGGDLAYAAPVSVQGRDETLLVYGSASPADLATLLESLVLNQPAAQPS